MGVEASGSVSDSESLEIQRESLRLGEVVRKMADELVGKVIHYYDKIGVAIVRLDKKLKVGERVKFVKGEDSFEETVESMQIEHEEIQEGKKGQEVGIKVSQKAKEGTLVYVA